MASEVPKAEAPIGGVAAQLIEKASGGLDQVVGAVPVPLVRCGDQIYSSEKTSSTC